MMKRTCGVAAMAAALCGSATARAEPADDRARADASFQDGMRLRNDGHDAEACPKFAESKLLAPAVGVTLYLAECYERTGRTASAWHEFRAAEKLARERGDKRADVAAQRARALEPRLYRLTVAVPPVLAGAPGAAVLFDGAPLASEEWNAPLAIDAGDHVVVFSAPGRAAQTLHAHVDGGNASAVVRVEDSSPTAAGVAATPTADASPVTPSVPSSSGDAAARLGGIGLVVAGALGIGVGTFFVTSKTSEMSNGQICEPHLRAGAIPAATVAFSAGGVALISGLTLYYLHRPGRTEASLTPAVMPGGAGAVLRGTF